MEVAIMRRGVPVVMMGEEVLQAVIEEIEKEIEAAKAKKEAENQARK